MALKIPKAHLDEEDNPWLFTYADMVTLLFTFFVLLYAISNPDPVKLQLLSNYFSDEKKMTFTELQQKIEEYIVDKDVEGQVSVKVTSKGVEVSFKDKVLFGMGKADLKDAASPILTEISKLINYEEIKDRKLYIEGHTDSVPIKSKVFPSNWELSSARSASVVRFFAKNGVKKERFVSIGYADTRPLEEETDPVLGQAKNRRVVVVISPESYLTDFKRPEIEVKPSTKKREKKKKKK